MVEVSPPLPFRAMELITILNRCHRFRGLSTSTPTSVPTRRASKWPCDRARVRPLSARAAICRRPVTTNSPNGALSYSPVGVLVYTIRRVDCRRCGVVAVSWKRRRRHFAHPGTRSSTRSNMSSLGVWNTGRSATPSASMKSSTGHKYLTLVYQIDLGVTRLSPAGWRAKAGHRS